MISARGALAFFTVTILLSNLAMHQFVVKASPLGITRQQGSQAMNMANMRGFVNDLKSRLRGELSLLMALQQDDSDDQGSYIITLINTIDYRLLN